MHQEISSGAGVLDAKEYQVNFQGSAEFLEIDSTKIAFTVERFTMTGEGTTVELLKPGSVIVADERAQEPVSLKGGTMDEKELKAFLMVYTVHKQGAATDDDMFGTKERKTIGDSWSINVARVFDTFNASGLTVPPGHLSGTVTLVAKDEIGSIDCLRLRGEFAADGLSSTDLRTDLKLDQIKMQANFHACFPIEDSGLSFERGIEATMQAHITDKQGTAVDSIRIQRADSVWIARRN
jgi:hypothetical protein